MNGVIAPGHSLPQLTTASNRRSVRFASIDTPEPAQKETGETTGEKCCPAKKSGSLVGGIVLGLIAYTLASFGSDSKTTRYSAGAAGFLAGFMGFNTLYSFGKSVVQFIGKTVQGGKPDPADTANAPVISKPDTAPQS